MRLEQQLLARQALGHITQASTQRARIALFHQSSAGPQLAQPIERAAVHGCCRAELRQVVAAFFMARCDIGVARKLAKLAVFMAVSLGVCSSVLMVAPSGCQLRAN